MENGIVDLISFDQGFAWDHWAVWYFLLVGSAAGALLIAFIAAVRDQNAPEIRPALFAAAACGLTAAVPLLADLHQPARFMHFYLGTAPHSIMWWGSWFLPAFVGGLAMLVVLYSPFGDRFAAYRRYLWYWTAIFSVAVLAYTAGEMTIVRARPVWHETFFPIMLTLSAIISGSGAVSIVAAVRGQKPGIAPQVLATGSALFVVGVAVWIAAGWGKNVVDGGAFADLALNANPVNLLFLMTGICGVGGLVMALVASRAALFAAVSGLLAVVGALIFRWELFMGGQAQLKLEAGFLPHALINNNEALAGLIGTVGLLAVVVVVLSFVLNHEGENKDGHTASHSVL